MPSRLPRGRRRKRNTHFLRGICTAELHSLKAIRDDMHFEQTVKVIEQEYRHVGKASIEQVIASALRRLVLLAIPAPCAEDEP